MVHIPSNCLENHLILKLRNGRRGFTHEKVSMEKHP